MSLTDEELQAFEDFERAGWEKAADPYHRMWGALSSQSSGPMLDAAGVSSGSKVLDVACGAGYIAAEAANRGCEAVGLDFSQAQLDLASKTYPDIAFQYGSAEELPFEPESFDAVVIGFGMNHMPKPEAVFGQAFRVLKPGGRFAFTIWDAPKPAEAFGIVLSALERFGRPNPDLPAAPPYFRMAEPDTVAAMYLDAGFVAPSTTSARQFWYHYSADDVFDAFSNGAVRVTALLRSQPEEALAAIKAAVRSDVETLKQGDTYVVPAPAALSVGRKP